MAQTDKLTLNIQTNNYLNASDHYVVQIKQKEKILQQDLQAFGASKNYTLTYTVSSWNITNGGLLAVYVYRLNTTFKTFDNSTKKNTTIAQQDLDTVVSWL